MARKPTKTDDDEPKKNVSPDAITKCAAEYEDLMGKRARLDALIGAMFNRYEKEEGVKRGAVKKAYRRRNMDADEVRAEIEDELFYSRVLGQIEWDKGGQGSFAAAIASPAPKISADAQARLARARAHADGYNSGKRGAKVSDTPSQFTPGSEEFVAWRDGWQDGAADREAKKPSDAKVVEATPRKGRKKGADGAAATA